MAEQKTAYQRFCEYRDKGCHMLIPSQISPDDIAPGFALIVEPVLLKAHPREKDVYAHDSAQYDYKADDWKAKVTGAELVRIHKQGFDRLAQAARIDWLPAQVVRDPNHNGRMMASVEGMIRTSTGELYRVQDIAGMDLDIEREKLEQQYRKAEQKWLIERDFLQKKANQAKLCISGAKNRVIKQLLCLRNTYTVAELAKEFVAVRIVPRLDMNDEYTRRRVVDVQIAAMAGIYGLIPNTHPEQKQIEMSGDVPESAMIDDPAVIEGETTNGNGAKAYPLDKSTTMAQQEEDVPFSLDIPTTAESLRADFENSDADGQAKTLTVMISQRGQQAFVSSWLKEFGKTAKFAKTPATLETISPSNRLKLYDHLLTVEAGKGQVAA